jgi:hypothetical protein
MVKIDLRLSWLIVFLAATVTMLPAGHSARAADAPLYDFETDVQGWISLRPEPTVAVTREKANVKVGEGALEWAYDPSLPNLMLMQPQPQLKPGANTLEFWLRCSATSALQIFLVERDRSVYHMHLRPGGGQWHHYRVALSDLMLGETVDENNQLDLDQVRQIVVQDLSQYHAQPEDLTPRKLWLDGLTFTRDVLPQRRLTRTVDGKQEALFDDFEDEILAWAGNTRTTVSLEKVDGRKVLRAVYGPGFASKSRFQLASHFDPRYATLSAVKVVARASRPVQLIVQLREFDGTYTGPDYQAFCAIPGGKEWQTRLLPISDFKAGPRQADPDNRLDIKSVWLLRIGDASPPQANAGENVELEIDSIAAVLPQ